MNSPFRPKTINVPGVLSDDAFQQQLKQYTDQQNAIQDSAPAPDSAVDFASKIQDEYLKAPTPSIARSAIPAALPGPLGLLASGIGKAANAGPPQETEQDRLVRLRSDLLSQAIGSIPDALKDSTALSSTPFGAALGLPGAISQAGTLTDPNDRKAAAEQQLADAKMQQEADANNRATTAQSYNDLSDEELMASVPGASSPEQARAALALSEQTGAETQKMFAGKTAEKQANVDNPARQPTQTWWLNAIQNGIKGVASIPIGASRGFAEAAEMARDVSGVDLLTGGGRSNMRAWIDTVDQTMNKLLPGDKARAKDFVTQLSQGTGSMLGFLMGGYAAAAAGVPSTAATTILGAATGGDQSFQDAENFNATTLQKYMAFIIGAGIGTTEAIPIDRMFMRADQATGGLVRRMLNHTLAGSLEEFIQETGQQMGQDVLAKFLYDPNRKMDVGSWLTAGAIGALSGGLAGAATTGLHEAGVTHNVQAPEITDLKQREQLVNQAITTVQGAFDKIVPPVAAPAEQPVAQRSENAAPVSVPAATADRLGIPPEVAAQIVPQDSVAVQRNEQPVKPGKVRASEPLVPIGRDAESGAALAVPQDVFAQQSRSITETPEFKNWFGESKVVDESGQPLVVYHGTGTSFDQFYAFSHFGTVAAANERLDSGNVYGGDKQILPVYLNIEKPLRITDNGLFDYGDIMDAVHAARGISDATEKELAEYYNENGADREFVDMLSNAIESAGYDGLVYKNVEEDKGSDSYIALKPEQIKSAFNGGNFDPNNPDILAQRMGTSNSRQPVKGEPTRPAQGVASQQGAPTSDVSLAQLSKNLIGLMDLTARQGRITIKGPGVLGQYSRKQDVIRVKTWNDFSTLAHEAGHALYFDASDPLKVFIAGHDAELMDVATKTYGGDVNKLPKAEHIAEGFAELFRLYATNKAYAQREFPAVTSAFENVLEQNAPELKQGLDLIGQQFAAWLQLPSVQLVRNMIVPGAKEVGINAAIKELRDIGFGTWMQEYTRKTVDGLVNKYTSVNAIVRDLLNLGQENKGKAIDLKRSEDPRILIRLAQNAGARAMVQASDGIMGYHGLTPESRSLRDALLLSQGLKVDDNLSKIDPVKKQDFAAYLVALRGIDEYRRFAEGKIERPPLAATLGDLQQTVQELNAAYPKFAEAAQVVNEYGMALWKKSYDAGLMDKETYTDGLDRQFYAPLQRDMSDRKTSLGASALTNGASIVKRFRGSDRNIVDPMDVLLHKTFATEQIIAKNDVAKALGLLADRAGRAGALVERIPSSQLIGKQYSVKEIARQLTKDDTISASDAQDLMEILQASIEDDNMLSLFRAEQASTKGENVLFYWEDGRLSALQVQDGDVGADLVNVMNGLGRENMPMFVNLIAQTSAVFRSSIVSWPDFLITNFIRDQMSAFILTDVGYKPFVTGIKGVFDELRQRQWAQQYNASMGIMGGMNVAALHEARVNRDLNSLRKKGYIARAFTSESGSYIGAAANGMAHVVELTETGTRLGIYKAAFQRAKKDGLGDWDAAIEAGYTATDYIDFGLNGSRMLLFRKTIPFLNAQLQGLNKMLRTLGGDEVRQRLGLRYAVGSYFKSINNLDLSRTEKMALQTGRKAWIKMASLGLISAALHFLFEDDPDYQEAGEYLRTTGWVIPLGNGRIFYIPKPFELAMVANFTERGIEAASGDPQAKFRFMRGLAMTLSPPTSPPAIQTAIELAANKDFFTGREIVPSYMQALQPQLQYDNYTTQLAKQIGQATGLSPMVVDHIMSSLGASAYRDLTTVYNSTDPNRPALDATDVPILRRFVRDVRRGSVSAQDFWKIASTVDGSLRTAEVTYKNYLEGGNTRAADEFLLTLSPDERAYAILANNFKADAKRLNPFYRARQVTTIISAMRREMVSELGLEDTTTKIGDTIKLSATEKQQLDDALSEYARREMRNTLIAEAAPGWAGKRELGLEPTHDLISAIDPRVSEELDRRLNKAKVYSFDIVNEYWPEVRDRLNRDRENTFLKDILTIAKVAR